MQSLTKAETNSYRSTGCLFQWQKQILTEAQAASLQNKDDVVLLPDKIKEPSHRPAELFWRRYFVTYGV